MRIRSILLVLALPGSLAAQQRERPGAWRGPTVLANGTGSAAAPAATATLIVGVQTTAESASAAAAENAQKQAAVVAAIRKQGVAADSIHTSIFSVGPEYRPAAEAGVARYVVNNSVEVRTADLAALGRLIDAALAAGANRVLGVRFGALDPAALERAALEDAVAVSRRNAQVMASALGGRLGELVEVANTPRGTTAYYVEAAASYAGPGTPITPRNITTNVTVATRWQFLKP